MATRATSSQELDGRRAARLGSAASLGLGLFFIFVWRPHPWGWQGINQYRALALALARGESFGTTDVPWGYAYFLAPFYLTFGDRPWIPLVVQAVLNSAVPLLLYELVAPLVDKRTAAVAALLAGLLSFNTVYASTQSSDSVCTVVFLLAVLLAARGLVNRRLTTMALAGICFGIASQFRPNLIAFPVVWSAVSVWRSRFSRWESRRHQGRAGTGGRPRGARRRRPIRDGVGPAAVLVDPGAHRPRRGEDVAGRGAVVAHEDDAAGLGRAAGEPPGVAPSGRTSSSRPAGDEGLGRERGGPGAVGEAHRPTV